MFLHSLLTSVTHFGVSALANWSASAGTIFSDQFDLDPTLNSPPWYNISSSTANTVGQAVGQGLILGTGTSGKYQEEVANFTLQNLAVGDSLTLTVNFSGSGMTVDNGALTFGLYNSGGVAMSANEVATASSGASAAYDGYFGDIGYNQTAGISSKFYSRTGTAGAANELGYYNKQTGTTQTQMASYANSSNADLSDNTPYTLTYTIMNDGVSGMYITANINGETAFPSFYSGAAPTYSGFDTLAIGNYDKTSAVNLTISSLSVDYTQGVPEPTPFAFAALGLLGGFIARFRRG